MRRAPVASDGRGTAMRHVFTTTLFAAALCAAGSLAAQTAERVTIFDNVRIFTGTADTLTAADVNQQQVEGVFNTLIRLKEALECDDLLAIERALSTFEEDITRVTLARGEIGARQRGLQVVQQRLDSEEIELRETLSKELDVDIAAAISEMTTRQIAMQASLRTMGSLLQVTLLNFL